MLPEPRTEAGAAALAALIADPAGALLALDYDGTLAPVVALPVEAVPAEGARDALVRCAAVFGTVALLTGRPALGPVTLAGLAGVPGLERLVVLGHYGNERWAPGSGITSPPEHPGLAGVRRTLPDLLADAPPGVLVEDKGLSVAVHTRGCADPVTVLTQVVEPVVSRVALDTGLEVQHGRLMVELRPPDALDKGSALRSIVAEVKPAAVLFAGDDFVDLPAFEVLAELRTAGVPTLGVFVDNPEAPPALRQAADVVVPDPATMVAMLTGVAAAAGGGG